MSSAAAVELLSCDFIVAAADATFRQIEVSVGNMPMAGGVQRMAERIGRSRAVLYAMLSLPIDRRDRGRTRSGELRGARRGGREQGR